MELGVGNYTRQLLIILAIIGLFGTMTNLLYISPIPSIVSALAFPLIISHQRKIPKTVFWLLIFFLISILSILIYHPKSLFNYGFYRYDGNFIISYLPLLVLPFFNANIDVEKIFKVFLYFSTILNVFAFAFHQIIGLPYFTSFFLATNAAGGFFSIMASLAFVFLLKRKNLFHLIIFFIQIIFMFATTSRGSILGLFFGILFFFCIKYHRRYLITFSFFIIIIFQIFIIYESYPVYEKYMKGKPPAEYYAAVNDYILNNYGPVSGKFANVLIRLYDTWPRGMDAFLSSPLLGTGFGSINDIPFKHEPIVPYLVNINIQENKIFNDSHAHHSYIHFLGEIGLVGLLIFLTFWYSVYRYLLRNDHNLPIRNFLLISFFNLSVMSLTEHRITTPSNALPFVLAFCLYFIYVNYQKKKEKLQEINVKES